jgi:hypothetical protein
MVPKVISDAKICRYVKIIEPHSGSIVPTDLAALTLTFYFGKTAVCLLSTHKLQSEKDKIWQSATDTVLKNS